MKPTIRVQSEDFAIAAEIQALTAGNPDVGAVVTFTGICRDEAGQLAALELEHYPGMAEQEIGRIATQAGDRWPLTGLAAIHRFGRIRPGENIVLVIAASKHRQAAFEAASFMMDFMKSRAPFWKKEIFLDGTEGGWVDARSTDKDALDRWSQE